MAKLNFRPNPKNRKSKTGLTSKTPGVYIEEMSKLPPSVAQVPTAVPAFIGHTEKHAEPDGEDLFMKAKRVRSLFDFQERYGKEPMNYFNRADGYIVELDTSNKVVNMNCKNMFFLYNAVDLFFANGGGECYIISVGKYSTDPSYGNKSSGMRGGLEVSGSLDEPTLIVMPDAVSLTSSNCYKLQQEALTLCGTLRDRFAILDIKKAENTTELKARIKDFRNNTGTNFLEFGAAYAPWITTIVNKKHWYHDLKGNLIRQGSNIPVDINTLASNLSGKEQEKIQEILAALDAINPEDSTAINKIIQLEQLLAGFLTEYNDIVEKVKARVGVLPPSGALAGLYALTDNNRGVWKAPANLSVGGAAGISVHIDEKFQENMNSDVQTGKSINAIRTFPGKGVLVWGARTLAGNDNEWRYISVRRLFNMVEESVKKSMEPFVFEPNHANTWIKVRSMVENYLTGLWREGGIAGAKPDEAFFVKIGLNETMTTNDIMDGRLILQIGMAAVRPAEFSIIHIMQTMQKK